MAEATELVEAESFGAVESEIEYDLPTKEIRTYIQANEIGLAILSTRGNGFQPIQDGRRQRQNRLNVTYPSDVGP